jgi:dihydrofolate reductase
MKVILVFVSTLDGKITKWGNPMVKSWASESDQQYFKQLWNSSRLIIMGSSTFNADPIKPSSEGLLIVMTRRVSDYINLKIPGRLEFSDESPSQLTARFKNDGYDQMMVVGGAHIATSFFKEQLIDEVWLTIEPKIFGTGGNFVTDEKLDINLRLISCEKVNDQGTLITKYAVLKN